MVPKSELSEGKRLCFSKRKKSRTKKENKKERKTKKKERKIPAGATDKTTFIKIKGENDAQSGPGQMPTTTAVINRPLFTALPKIMTPSLNIGMGFQSFTAILWNLYYLSLS